VFSFQAIKNKVPSPTGTSPPLLLEKVCESQTTKIILKSLRV